MPSALRPLIAELLQASHAQDPARFRAQSRRVFKSARGSEPGELTAAIADIAPVQPHLVILLALPSQNVGGGRHTAGMGSYSWSYAAPYTGDAATSLRALQEWLIRDRDYYWYWARGYPGVEFRPWPETLEELWGTEDYWDCGSGSILDIQRVVDTTRPPSDFHFNDDFSTVRPVSRDRLRRLFGTEKPTRAQFEALAADRQNPNYHSFWGDERMRS